MHTRAIFIVVLFLLAAAAHVFVALWLVDTVPRLRRHRRAVVAVAVAACTVTGLGRLGAQLSHSNAMITLVATGLTEWMIVMMGALPLALTMLAVRLVYRGGAPRVRVNDEAARPETATEARPEGVTRREVLERVGGTLALGASTACLGWGMVRGRHAFEIDEVPVRIAGLPRALDGYTIAQISDIHTGVFVGDRELGEGLDAARSFRADLVVVTGDMVDFDARFAPKLAAALRRLTPRDGTYAVRGNHDYYAGSEAVADALRRVGVEVLLNEARAIRAGDGGGFALLGVDDLWAARYGGAGPDMARAASSVSPETPRILLSHQPAFFDHAAGKVALQLSGHTHGGQINPGFRPADFFMRYVAGRYEHGGSTLWVNRGFGVAGPPARIGAPPEVTKIVLVAA